MTTTQWVLIGVGAFGLSAIVAICMGKLIKYAKEVMGDTSVTGNPYHGE